MSMKQVANIIRVKNSIDKIKENFTGEFTTALWRDPTSQTVRFNSVSNGTASCIR